MRLITTTLLTLVLSISIFGQSILPISRDVMAEVKRSYESGEIEWYFKAVVKGLNLTVEQEDDIRSGVDNFFDSNLFIETGAAYLTSLFNERELNDILRVLDDPTLMGEPDFEGARKFNRMMTTLKPYIVSYLKTKFIRDALRQQQQSE